MALVLAFKEDSQEFEDAGLLLDVFLEAKAELLEEVFEEGVATEEGVDNDFVMAPLTDNEEPLTDQEEDMATDTRRPKPDEQDKRPTESNEVKMSEGICEGQRAGVSTKITLRVKNDHWELDNTKYDEKARGDQEEEAKDYGTVSGQSGKLSRDVADARTNRSDVSPSGSEAVRRLQ